MNTARKLRDENPAELMLLEVADGIAAVRREVRRASPIHVPALTRRLHELEDLARRKHRAGQLHAVR